MTPVYELQGVVHLVRPAFIVASNLAELREGIANADDQTLFYHAVQSRLRSSAGGEQPTDDFSAWVNGVVQDRETAERLSFAAQQSGRGAAALRAAMLAVLDALSDGVRRARAAPEGGMLTFLATESVRVRTGEHATDAEALFDALRDADSSVWFFEFIERPWFEGAPPAPAAWLRQLGEPRIAEWLEDAARPAPSIETLRRQVLARWRRRHLGRRIAAGIEQTDEERREAARDAVVRLVRRIKKTGEPS